MSKSSIICAGIDTGKSKLDVAIDGSRETLTVGNDQGGHAALSLWLRQRGVERVGIEASGGYEAAVIAKLRHDGFVVCVLQPAQVRAYAKFTLQRAKNDKIDAALIAACMAATTTVRPPPDPRIAPLAAQLTLIEQLTEDGARLKTRRESCQDAARSFWTAEIARLKGLARHELALLVAAIRQHRDLAERLDLITSIPGVGLRTAVAILIRMPEVGRISRGQAAALAGLAPYDDDSGNRTGARHIAGGRTRLRGALFAAALPAAFRWNAQLAALYQRLIARGKSHKQALIACARKLIIYVNTVLARGLPWQPQPTPSPS